jgi:hypothetical protein
MRRTLVISLVALAALATAGIAGAWLKSTGTEAAAATFSATKVERTDVRKCTGTDGEYEFAWLRVSGEAVSSTEALNGPITLHVKSVYNVTKGLGSIEGWMRIRGGEDRKSSHGRFFAVNTGGTVDGFVVGNVNWRYAALFASVGGKFSATGGFTDGTIGTGTATNAGVFTGGRPCKPERKPRTSIKLSIRGTVEALDTTTAKEIKIKPGDNSSSQTCKLTADSPGLDGITVGDNVKAECHGQEGALVLVRIKELRN